jgi:hypothetical protein
MSIDSDKAESDKSAATAPRRRSWLRSVALHAVILLAWLVGIEAFLRIADFRDLRLIPDQYRLPHQHDSELGWLPVPNTVTRTGVRINSLGLRDIEPEPAGRPTILFVGDSFLYGLGVRDDERFTDRLRRDLTGFRIVNAGVAAYGTDQQYLLMRRLWPKLEPKVLVLIVCVDNDHADNSTSSSHGHTFKPYLANVGGEWKFQNIPVPRPHTWYYYNTWLGQRVALARLAVEAYTHIRYPRVIVPDPTSRLVGMMRDFARERGAKFLVGLQHHDRALEPFLIAENIPYTRLGDAEIIRGDDHWSPRGHVTVANRLKALFAAEGVVAPAKP